uniref:AN1-type zinc finger protein 3 isoform X1 n=1 Tax=Myxine glutinosa TaxID=7769 RepID=UPI00359002AC
MGDAGSECCPPRCSCGFFGSTETMNMCSKCYADYQKGQEASKSATLVSMTSASNLPGLSQFPDGGQPNTTPAWPSGAISEVVETEVTGTTDTSCQSSTISLSGASEPNLRSLSNPVCPALTASLATLDNPRCVSACKEAGYDQSGSGVMEAPCRKRARLVEEVDVSREKDMGAAIEEEHPPSGEQVTREEEQMVDDWNRPAHARKNKHRCFSCRAKLELVQQQLGLCRCERVFCGLHRLPEQHGCTFDHQGEGRQEALRRMVKPEKRVGRSFQRLGEECC